MKKIAFLFFNLLVVFSLEAQVITVSEALTLRTDMSYDVIGKLGDQYLVFQDNENTFNVQAYDENLKISWNKDIELDKRRPEVLGLVSDLEYFYIVYQHRWKNETIIKAHKYDAGANLVDSTTIKNLGFFFAARNYQIVRSDDRSKILVFSESMDRDMEVYSFDLKNMKFLWELKFKPESLILSRDDRQIVVSNKGKMYYIILKNNYRSRLEEHKYDIFHYDAGQIGIGRYEVTMEGKLTYDVYFEYDNLNDQLVAGGLYGNKNIAWAKGYFLLKIPEKNPSDSQLTFHDFTDDLVENFLERDAPSKNKGILETSVQEIILRRDGGILMVAERIKTTQRNYGATNSGGFYSRSGDNIAVLMDYFYEHLMVISIHPDGEQHWANVLRKKQYSQDDGAVFSSYFLVKTPASLHFIFNDEIKEENTVSEYVIQGNGAFERNSVMSTENQKLRLRFQDAVQTGAMEFVIPSERRNRFKLVKVKF